MQIKGRFQTERGFMVDKKTAPRRGCLFYGGLAAAVLLLLLLLGVLFGVSLANKMRRDFTDSQPVPLAAPRLAPADYGRLQQRIDTFRESIKYGRPTAPLELTADEINALIANDPDFQSIKGKLQVIIEGDQLKGQVSVSMAELGVPIFQDRYLNAQAVMDLRFNNEAVKIYPRQVMVKGKPIPEVYMAQIRKHNLGQAFNNDPRAGVAMEKLESIQIKNGRLVVTPKKN